MIKKNFKKKDIIQKLSKKTGFPANYSKKLINDLILIILQNIKEGNVNLKNFGKFKIIKKRERIGRNPKTRKEYIISARNVVSFIFSRKILKQYE